MILPPPATIAAERPAKNITVDHLKLSLQIIAATITTAKVIRTFTGLVILKYGYYFFHLI